MGHSQLRKGPHPLTECGRFTIQQLQFLQVHGLQEQPRLAAAIGVTEIIFILLVREWTRPI